ncbi:hypothetical protein FRACYDRAFT_245876 [Fragilariopsis cylindrus CCMP1102]|uniref:Uncharacterized protein n=1 Tax=Fragilariopsis cylindrus CCMP1102 TaxID=635003 RepID=A0A1E7F002_9STRA|nr:hypothetical protein FRACYDRAFT_245876 [Fragilariopsis cylindrus CCMP1102]|eukprot:OEU11394.1 hypothetical protein FRACYDRAFT_245876 [Fragilariopsis cylindrus CCMP1102]
MIFLGFMHFKVSFAADSDGWKKQLLVCSILDGFLVTNNDRLFHQAEEVNTAFLRENYAQVYGTMIVTFYKLPSEADTKAAEEAATAVAVISVSVSVFVSVSVIVILAS